MELFIDSVNMEEIQQAIDLGFVEGITTTPTFMQRQGIDDVDGAIAELSRLGPQVHVEALGESADEIVGEARRLADLPELGRDLTFKIPVTREGLKATHRLSEEGHDVNVHLVYTLAQAYLAAEAGASYICPLVGRLHDQGHDSFALIRQAVEMVEEGEYPARVMVSSVRHPEHVRKAVLAGAGAVTVPWKVLKVLPENVLTGRGIRNFSIDTQLTTYTVRQFVSEANPAVEVGTPVAEAALEMTRAGYGVVSVVDESGVLAGVLTDGDVRRSVDEEDLGRHQVEQIMNEDPLTITGDTVLQDAVDYLRKTQVDNLVVVDDENRPVGILDVQHLLQEGFMG